jgi:predicted site-specific integrase-resolvase
MPSTDGPKRAILYARVSTDEQARCGYSLAQQLEALRPYAANEGYEILEEVEDPGQSGASLERPGMDRVRDLVAAALVHEVMTEVGEEATNIGVDAGKREPVEAATQVCDCWAEKE